MNSKPLVSVVIPTYNRAQRTIASTESVFAQTYPNLEIIVIDDGSKDGSSEIIEKFLEERKRTQNGRQIHYFKQPNQGASAARNAGIERARGEFIAFLDSDDTWLPEKLEQQLAAMAQHSECGACSTDTLLISDSRSDLTTFKTFGRVYEQETGVEASASALIAKSFNGFWISTLLARTELIRRLGGLDTAIQAVEDRDLHFRLSLVTSFAYVNKVLARIDRTSRTNESQCRSWEAWEVQLRSHEQLYEKWLKIPALPPQLRKTIVRNLGATHSTWTNWYLETERYESARKSVSKALDYAVTPGLSLKWALTWLAPAFLRRITAKAIPYT
jgi:cellulose synthase/poly-beta-1,6-N-acetylglucosamine synthase-like glycosyltransferase